MVLQRLHVAAVMLVLVWFVVIAPGHQRGALTLPGPSDARTVACCPLSAVGGTPSGSEEPGDSPPAPPCHDPAQSCAICQLVTTLAAPPHLDLTTPSLGPLPSRPCAAVASRPLGGDIRGFQARPPPPSPSQTV